MFWAFIVFILACIYALFTSRKIASLQIDNDLLKAQLERDQMRMEAQIFRKAVLPKQQKRDLGMELAALYGLLEPTKEDLSRIRAISLYLDGHTSIHPDKATGQNIVTFRLNRNIEK